MAETALNFGPDWIRALATGSNSSPAPTAMPIPRYSLAQFRYGREEMLALIPKDIESPKCLLQLPHLVCEKFQIPLALTPQTEEEQRAWTRSVNSDMSLRASGKTGPGYGMNRTGRGGSIDRGRGRGRGGYYQRGLMHDDAEDGPPSLSRPKVERSLSANEKDHRWDDRDRRYDRPFSGQRGMDDNMKQENTRGPNDYWRKFDKDDDGDWRSSGFRSEKMGGRGSWRNNSDRERRDVNDRNSQNRNRGSSGPPSKAGNQSWNKDNQSGLPEWSVEETAEPDTVGTFDSSGAFLETKAAENTSLDEIYASDDADEGLSDDIPEANKDCSKKLPNKSPNSISKKQTPNKQSAKDSSETRSIEDKPVRNASESSKNNSKNPPKSVVVQNPTSNVIKTVVEKHPVKKEPDVIPVTQSNVPSNSEKMTKVKSVLLSNVRNSESAMSTSGVVEEDTFAHHQKATENMVAQWTEEIEQRVASPPDSAHPNHRENENKWFYQDPQGELQGPFTSHEMLEWFTAGYFAMSLMVRRGCDETFSQLGDLIKSRGHVPFIPGSSPPPVRATPLKSSLATPVTQTTVPNPVTVSTSAHLPKQDEQLLVLQQQLYQQQQQLMQQQFMFNQAQLQTLLGQLKQQENFTNLTSQQQQQVLMQQFIAQKQMPRPTVKSEKSGLLESMAPMPMPLLGLSLPPMLKNNLSLWQAPPSSGAWPMTLNEPPGASIWDMDLPKPSTEESETEKMKILAEQERIRKAEELRLEHEREMEEKTEELRHKQEEALILKELKIAEEERNRLEELQREEKLRQEELKRMEEQRREEEQQEELRKQEELKRMEELRKQQEELQTQKELRKKQEEEKKLEELKRKELCKQQEELQKQKELQKQEERRKKEEMLKKIQMEKEQEKQLEFERQREALRNKELEREERLEMERKEREEAEMRRIAELKKSQGPAWGIQNHQISSEMSLTDIQRLQEEKERQEREEKMRQQLLQQQCVKQVQHNKNSLSWAKRANDSQPVVKSLFEIQQEEADRLAQFNRMQKPQLPPPNVSSNAGVWGNSSHLSKITTPPLSWNSNSTTMTGFWDDALHSTQARKQPQKSSNDSAFPALSLPVQPAVVNSNKSKNVRAKKEEDAVARLFGSHHKPTDEFTKWCTEAISAMPSSVDVPTFVAFLKDIESPYEVYDYVKSYFGEGKEPKEFSKLFLEKRSKFRNQAKQVPTEDNTLWGPAPAITPLVNKTIAPITTECDGNSSTRGKTKKRKGKMQKLDSSMLGFTVQSNPDRLNVGEIDHIENI